MAEKHDLHLFDEDKQYYVRQVTDPDEDNCWELCNASGDVIAELNDDEFDQLRDTDRDNPKGIE